MTIDKPAWGNSAEQFIDNLFSWLSHEGQSRYDEAVTQLEHALQGAALAECETSQNNDIAAALLHDVGHLLMKEHWQREDFLDKDLKHEIVGANWLQQFSREPVTESIRLHVPAKRYLCAVDAQYWSGLSDGSKTSLVKQAGPITEREVDEFELAPGHDAAVRLRRIDDRAKVVGLDVPPLFHYADAVLSLLTAPIQR